MRLAWPLFAALIAPPLAVDHRLEAPPDRRDASVFYSAPDSLHLKAHDPGNAYHRFASRPVRGGTRYRLRFRYLVARGTEGEFSARASLYNETETTWRVLPGGPAFAGAVVGRWAAADLAFRAHPDATAAAVDFRLDSPCQVGEAWVDDVSLAPEGQPVTQGP